MEADKEDKKADGTRCGEREAENGTAAEIKRLKMWRWTWKLSKR